MPLTMPLHYAKPPLSTHTAFTQLIASLNPTLLPTQIKHSPLGPAIYQIVVHPLCWYYYGMATQSSGHDPLPSWLTVFLLVTGNDNVHLSAAVHVYCTGLGRAIGRGYFSSSVCKWSQSRVWVSAPDPRTRSLVGGFPHRLLWQTPTGSGSHPTDIDFLRQCCQV